jgi:arylsulfatase
MNRTLTLLATMLVFLAHSSSMAQPRQPNILVIWGDDIGWQNVSAYGMGTMGYPTPHIDSIGMDGVRFTDHYAQPSCTAGRASFITGQYPIRSGMTTVGVPGDPLGLQAASPSLGEVMKKAGYRTGHFGKNHLGDRNEHLPTAHGFDEFFGNLYHLNTQEQQEYRDYQAFAKAYPGGPEAFAKKFATRGVLHSFASGTDTRPRIRGSAASADRPSRTRGRSRSELMEAHLRTLAEYPPVQGGTSFDLSNVVQEFLRRSKQ